MSRSNLFFSVIPTLVSVLVLVLELSTKLCNAQMNHVCPPSSCGEIHNISYPLRLKTDPQHCGFPSYELSCENNQTVLYLYSSKYYVQAIDYSNSSLRIVDAAISKDDCSSLPQFSMTGSNFSHMDPYTNIERWWSYDYNTAPERDKVVTFLKCANPVNSLMYVDAGVCRSEEFSYVIDNFTSVADVVNSCRIDLMVLSAAVARVGNNVSVLDVHHDLAFGFRIWWDRITYVTCKGKEYGYRDYELFRPDCSEGFTLRDLIDQIRAARWLILMIIGALVVTKHILCTPCVLAFLVYTWSRRHVSMYDSIEEFLQSQNNQLGPVRYSYSAIRKMTNGFKDKLGEGGYGSVYKGKLRSGRFAAVKILGKSSANGQDFINEVASIGQVHHINVVQLIGFCAEGSKRALVYDFMPNGSLDKYVLSREKNIHLSWKKMHDVALGVARGIDYLHRGCKIQILHFDIKPHNILLDENFVPKVSDFGLAKLQATSDSNVTLTAARGTIGYIAPELFYKNIGGVSYKADVYSFGMLLMEMVGKKNNSNAEAEHSSQTYFPNWVYNEIIDGKVELENATEDEETLAKKMITVALWCIQMKPSDRPSMNKVVKMLEEDLESLPIPSKPALWPEQTVCENEEDDYTGAKTIFGVPCVFIFLIYKWRRRHLSVFDSVEEFLRSQNNLMPVRYSYSKLRKMTNDFKEKLGEGGYGSVYKGKLRSGDLVAVKILGKSNANGQEFINEVATIGRIYHVNIVRLIGFCADGSKRALVYDFMPNGSLDKHILSQENHTSLSWDRMFEISLGVARGIEYLHRGCAMQILHFDIKPHNILLDENFTPKVSDFGLAKLYPTNDMVVSITAARGTIGYIAPELFYKNIGGVSYKADVYSFGMLLMEMTGKRKSNIITGNSSQSYFPFCVYDQILHGMEINIEDTTEDEKKIVKKMVVVALWCIQFNPMDRPSMTEVVKMLEGESENIQLPPRLFLYPEETLVRETTPWSLSGSIKSTNLIGYEM